MAAKTKRVVVAGHICLDITPLFPSFRKGRLEEILSPGKLIQMDGVDVHTGGAVANTGLAMMRLGADVTLMGKVGADEFGSLVLEMLRGQGYQGELIVSPKVTTSYSVVLALPGIDRIFLHSPGANDDFSYEDLDFDAIRRASLFHFGYPPLMKGLYTDGGRELERIFRRVKSLGVATSLDLAAVDPSSPAGQADWGEILRRVLPWVDFFVPSAEELCFMLDRPCWEEWMIRAKGGDVTLTLFPERDIRPLAEKALYMGARAVLVKCGVPGLYCRTGSREALGSVGQSAGLDTASWADWEHFEPSYVPQVVRSGTGAGDTSIAAFLTAMLDGRSPAKCLQLAAATGASCVEEYDALSGLRSFEQLEEKIAAGWKKQILNDT